MKKLTFFTLRDFSKHGGGSLRIKGILNALAKQKVEITLLSNAENYSEFDERIKHIQLNIDLTKKEKKIFQLLLATIPLFIINILFMKKLSMFRTCFEKNNLNKKEIIFFENLDNSLGYYFKKNSLISKYINDVHGIAPMEFKEKKSIGFTQKIITYMKYMIASKIDEKVFNFADGLIFVSNGMKQYFEDLYPGIAKKNLYVISDGVNKSFCKQKIDQSLLKEIKVQYRIKDHDKVVFFAGAFKNLGGVIDLIEAFAIVLTKLEGVKLFLIGEGELMALAIKKIQEFNMEDNVIFAGTVSYEQLKTYQQIADVIVCPDIKHPYSDIVPHVKYFDSLASGKIVINGAFDAIKEINKNQELSIDFEPSNINDLSEKIIFCLQNLEDLSIKYKDAKEVVCSKYLYHNSIEEFYKKSFMINVFE